MSIFVQPCRLSKRVVREHYERTLEQRVRLDEISELIGDDTHAALQGVSQNGGVYLWGVVPGRNNDSEFEKLRAGDTGLLTGDKHVHGVMTVGYVFRDRMPTLARQLWGEDSQGRSWEHMYAIQNWTSADIPYDRIREPLGYKPNWNPQRFQVFDDDQSSALRQALPPDTGDFESPHVSDLLRRVDVMLDRTNHPHKPLLLLCATADAENHPEAARLRPFEAYEGRLVTLLTEINPDSTPHPEYPFTRLQTDDLWELERAEGLGLPERDPSRRELRQAGTRGGLTADDYDVMLSDRDVRRRVAARITNHLPAPLSATAIQVLELAPLVGDLWQPSGSTAAFPEQGSPPPRSAGAPSSGEGSIAEPGLLADGGEERTELGLRGEIWVVALERERLRSVGRNDLADRVVHVSREIGDGLGYDVRSFDVDGTERCIEVKTTRAGAGRAFVVSPRELQVSRNHPDRYWLYRVHNFGEDPRYWTRRGALDREWFVRPSQYTVYPTKSPQDD